MSETKVNIVLVGAGYWGKNLARNFHESPHYNLLTVVDKDVGKLDRIQNLYPVDVSFSLNDVFLQNHSDVDAVAVASPPNTHYDIGKDALEAGKHLLIEKPFTIESSKGQELVELGEEQGVKICVDHTFKYSSRIRKLKEILEGGELGDILYVESKKVNLGKYRSGVNVLYDLLPHDLSILRYLFGNGMSVNNLQAVETRGKGVWDLATLDLGINNIDCSVTLSWTHPEKVREMIFIGEDKMMCFDDLATNPITIYDAGFEGYDHYKDRVEIVYVDDKEPLRELVDDFYEAIVEDRNPAVTGEDGLKIVELIEEVESHG